MINRPRLRWWFAALAAIALVPSFGLAQQHPPITILINESPWFAGFEALVDAYVAETGNQVNLNVTPFPGMLQRSRNAVTAGTSEFDLINLNEQWYSLFYSAGLVTPILDIDPDFELDPQVIEYAYATRWDSDIGYSTADGELYGLPINGNIQLLFYRADLFEQAGLSAPTTWDEVEAAAQVLHDPPARVGLVTRTAPTDWEFQSYLRGFGASVIEVDESGTWRVGIADPEGVAALERYIQLNRDYGPANFASVSQAEALSLMQSGRAAMAHVVGAAAPNFENPEQSIVQGLVQATIVPGPTADTRATMSGIWVMGIPQNLPDARKEAALAFMRWALTEDAQMLYARAGAIPVRQDVYETLGQEDGFRWMQAMAASTPYIQAQPRVAEAPQIIQAFGTQVAAALLGQVTAQQALEAAAAEIHRIMVAGGHDVAPLD
jgi:multiple sugar transport system substrate-binding protein